MKEEPPTASREKEKGRLLVVDDELALQELFASVLRDEGWEVDVARNGVEGLRLLADHRYEVVLSDIDMPQMKCLQLLIAWRARALDVPVVLVTASARLEAAIP